MSNHLNAQMLMPALVSTSLTLVIKQAKRTRNTNINIDVNININEVLEVEIEPGSIKTTREVTALTVTPRLLYWSVLIVEFRDFNFFSRSSFSRVKPLENLTPNVYFVAVIYGFEIFLKDCENTNSICKEFVIFKLFFLSQQKWWIQQF